MSFDKDYFLFGGLFVGGALLLKKLFFKRSKEPQATTPVKKPPRTPMKDSFTILWLGIDKTVPYNSDWDHPQDGVTFIDCNDPRLTGLEIGERRKVLAPDGRRMIIVGTRHGHIGFYERYPVDGTESETEIIRSDTGRKLRDVDHIYRMCGMEDNVGTLFEDMNLRGAA